MRFLSQFSMALALVAFGTVAVTALPQEAQAKKKKKKDKAAKIKISDAIKPQVGTIQVALAGEDPASAKPLVDALLAQPLTGDDQFIAGQLALQLGTKLSDTGYQEKGINASLASGRTSAEQVPSFSFFSGNFAYGAGRYAEAAQRFQAAFDAGYRKNNVGALIAEAYFQQNKNREGLAALNRAIGAQSAAGGKSSQDWFRRGAGIAMKSKIPGAAAEWTYKLVEAYPTGVNWRAALSVYRDSATPKLSDKENLELMRLMRKADAMESERDYFEYADAAGPRRLPGEVVSVLEEGLAKGDVSNSSLYVKETLATARGAIAGDRASLGAAERDSKSSGNGKIALATADALLGYESFGKAANLYQLAITKGGIDNARAQIGLGTAKVGQSDWDGARKAFGAVTGHRKVVAKFWNLWIDQKNAPVAEPAPAAAEVPTEG